VSWRHLMIATLLIAGCAAGPELQELRKQNSITELADTPFFPQDEYQCGPAALATVLVSAGVNVTPLDLVSQIYIPDRRGSLQAELLSATRRNNRVPYVMQNAVAPILDMLSDGHPVLVLQNLGWERWPIWHYAVLIGFDAEKEVFLLRSGTTQRLRSSARSFLASWDRGGRWAMAVFSVTAPPAGADSLTWLQAVAPFESTGKLDIAVAGYEAAVARWPDSALAWTALGNARYLQQTFTASALAYEHALALAPELWTARNNLVHTLIALSCPELAQPWIQTTDTPPAEMAETWEQTLAALAATPPARCQR
jgi:tetratricopeptide (TPR) repeat protein